MYSALAIPDLPALGRLLWLAGILGYAALLIRLCRMGLAAQYRFFVVFLGFRLGRSLLLFAIPAASNIYGWTWVATSPLGWFVSILAVLEIYSLVLKNYGGLATFGRWVLSAALGIAVLVAVLTTIPDLSQPNEPYPVIVLVSTIERAVSSSLVVFLLLITAFIAAYPVPLKRNIVIHAIIFSAYFLAAAMTHLVRTVSGSELTPALNAAMLAASAACLFLWLPLLRMKGEDETVILARRWHPEHCERLVDELASINSILLRRPGEDRNARRFAK